MGGENIAAYRACVGRAGSSPRGRGKPACTIHRARCIGLIPAWAGKTRRAFRAPACSAAHPRVGGENHLPRRSPVRAAGSSPRGRGKQLTGLQRRDLDRLIPAWAGKTRRRGRRPRPRPAHPRVGGENMCTARDRRRPSGSSPRGRGKRRRSPPSARRQRLIPAWAGKTPGAP